MPERKCETCEHYWKDRSSCTRFPPQIYVDRQHDGYGGLNYCMQSDFPWVDPAGRCGEWVSKD